MNNKQDEKDYVRITVTIRPEQNIALRKRAISEGVSISRQVKDALDIAAEAKRANAVKEKK
ncbi:hypothetical protein OPU71_10305 [Niveibacterium sp. 24ML]|uniref:hypothetical protein n=1 Tax=Niveibacterium sp. 24ML TaxID=2985512 RepID=UPI0022704E7F|nr:hypothetical protein [Niveibacterium sp. 24ML]MCX9156513.1 hypothetical protein [Niveibacterium sp. 24ML]